VDRKVRNVALVCAVVTKHVQELLVAHVFAHVLLLNTLGFLVAFSRGLQAVHFSPQAHELGGLDRPRLALHLPQHAVVCPGILWVVGREIAGVVQVQVLPNVFVQVIGLDFTAE